MDEPTQQPLTAHEIQHDRLKDETLLSNYLIHVITMVDPDQCRWLLEQAPYISEQCRDSALNYIDTLISEGRRFQRPWDL